MNMEKLKEVLADESFAKSLFELGSAAEVQTALQAKGVELTEEQTLAICEFGGKLKDGELSEETLEKVAGGGFWESIGDFLCEWLGHLGGC